MQVTDEVVEEEEGEEGEGREDTPGVSGTTIAMAGLMTAAAATNPTDAAAATTYRN